MKITEEGLLKIGFVPYKDSEVIGNTLHHPKLPLRYYGKTLRYGALSESTKVKTIEGVKFVIKAFKIIEGIK